jgi:ATP-binding cassette subfamily F protein 3
VCALKQVAYELHLEEMKASLAGMPVAHVHHGNGDEGSTVKDIHMTNFNISVGGRELIKDGSITLSHGRHYGQLMLDFGLDLYEKCLLQQ